MAYIIASAVRAQAGARGKWVSKSYIAWLDRKVRQMVESHIDRLGSRKMLNAEDAEALENFR